MTDETEQREPGITFLNACEKVNQIILDYGKPNKPPPIDVVCHLLLGTMPNLRLDMFDEVIEAMRADGLGFAWISKTKTEPPYCLIDLQHNDNALIVPPFLYVATSYNLVGLVTTTGMYAVFTDDETNEPEQVWTRQYRIITDDNGYPCYSANGRQLVSKQKLDEAYGEHTRH